MRHCRPIGILLLALAGEPAVGPAAADDDVISSFALAQFGEPELPADFTHFRYANPDAPRGGSVTLGAGGSFDSLNVVALGGEWPVSLSLIYDTLMTPAQDEISTYYPLIAERVEYPADRSWIVFHLHPGARFHDDTPITAEDVAWTFESIREHGRPFLRAFYEDVSGVEILDAHRVRFTFETRDVMQPLIRVAELTVLPRHWWTAEDRDISRATLEIPLGSGPYRLVAADAGRGLVYERVEEYWAQDLPARRGQFNFDQIDYDYYRDRDIMFQAFLAGTYDFRHEFTSRNWATGYDIPAVTAGRLVRDTIDIVRFRGIQGFFMNLRLPQFQDRRVREALLQLYPFDWVNRTIMYGLYQRIDSYFPGEHDWGARGLPGPLELEILEPYRDRLPAEVFTQAYAPPDAGDVDRNRRARREALRLFAEAGWEIRDGRLVHVETGEPMSFEILLRTPSLEPHTQPYVRVLEQVGIEASVRWVDSAQYQRRYQDRDFEMISFAYTFYPPPGGELYSYFGSVAADVPGSANVMGIDDPLVDALIETVIATQDLDRKQAASRALDRVLLWGHYAVPHWHGTEAWIAYWDMFGKPDTQPPYDFGFPNVYGFQPTWWVDNDRAAALARGE